MARVPAKLRAAIVAAGRKRRGKSRRFPPARTPPDSQYRAALVAIAKESIDVIRRELLPAVAKLEPAARNDADDTDIVSLIARLRVVLGKRFSAARIAQIAKRHGKSIDKFNEEDFLNQFKSVIGIDLAASPKTGPAMNAFVAENVDLIKSIPMQLLDDVEKVVREGATAGARAESIAKNIEARFGVTERRARLIARDQTNKLYANVAEMRQREVGVKRYIWRTSGQDERVRGNPSGKYPNAMPSHWHREGKVFSYDDPPEGGGPGSEVGCRCRAEPILEDVLTELGI